MALPSNFYHWYSRQTNAQRNYEIPFLHFFYVWMSINRHCHVCIVSVRLNRKDDFQVYYNMDISQVNVKCNHYKEMFCFIEPERIIIDCVLHLNIWNGCIQILVHAFKKLRINLLHKKVHIKEVDLPMNKHFAAFTLIRSQSIFVPFFLFCLHTMYILYKCRDVVIYIAVSNVRE